VALSEASAWKRAIELCANRMLMALAEDPQWCSANFPTWLMVRLSG
jgi:hypothetical protein